MDLGEIVGLLNEVVLGDVGRSFHDFLSLGD